MAWVAEAPFFGPGDGVVVLHLQPVEEPLPLAEPLGAERQVEAAGVAAQAGEGAQRAPRLGAARAAQHQRERGQAVVVLGRPLDVDGGVGRHLQLGLGRGDADGGEGVGLDHQRDGRPLGHHPAARGGEAEAVAAALVDQQRAGELAPAAHREGHAPGQRAVGLSSASSAASTGRSARVRRATSVPRGARISPPVPESSWGARRVWAGKRKASSMSPVMGSSDGPAAGAGSPASSRRAWRQAPPPSDERHHASRAATAAEHPGGAAGAAVGERGGEVDGRRRPARSGRGGRRAARPRRRREAASPGRARASSTAETRSERSAGSAPATSRATASSAAAPRAGPARAAGRPRPAPPPAPASASTRIGVSAQPGGQQPGPEEQRGEHPGQPEHAPFGRAPAAGPGREPGRGVRQYRLDRWATVPRTTPGRVAWTAIL